MQGIMQEIVRRGKNALILITWDGETGYIMYICRQIDRWNIDKYIDRQRKGDMKEREGGRMLMQEKDIAFSSQYYLHF